jgi:hypothetical protein
MSRGTRRAQSAIAFVLLLVAIAIAPSAFADESSVETARAAFRKGAELAKDAQWGAALASFERSAKLVPHPWTTYNIGICERALGHYVRARRTFARALAERRTDAELPEEAAADSGRYMSEIDRLVATLEVTLEPKEAAIAVDGQPIEVIDAAAAPPLAVAGTLSPGPGKKPPAATFRLALDPGTHVFLLTRPGFADAVVRQTVRPGEATSVKLHLDRLPGTLHVAANRERAVVTVDQIDVGVAPVTLSRPAGRYRVRVVRPGYAPYEVDAVLRPGERVELAASLREEKPSITQRWWFWTAAGLVVAGAAIGTYALTRPDPERPAPSGGGLGWVVHTQ